MNAPIAIRKDAGLPALAMSEAELMDVLRNSLYVGAKDESIKMVMGYCNAAGLDVMQKPVHLVPMWDGKAKTMRDVVMPGIGLYRTQAARSGEYAGVTEPEYGEDVTRNIGGVEITYPAWCKVVVKRLLANGTIAEFAATERWIENYAVKGGAEKSIAPNAMWTKRPYGQIAKCAEAQALRKAFPEFGAQPTADEMEGKTFDEGTVIDGGTGEIISTGKNGERKAELPAYTDEQLDANFDAWQAAINAGKTTPQRILAMVSTKFKLSDSQAETIRSMKPEAKKKESGVVDAEFVSAMEAAEGGAQ